LRTTKSNNLESQQFTPLHTAVLKGYLPFFKLLIAHGARTDAKTAKGNTVLRCGAVQGHADIVNFLLKNNVNVDSWAINETTPLHKVSLQGHLCITVMWIIAHCASVDAMSDGNTPPASTTQ